MVLNAGVMVDVKYWCYVVYGGAQWFRVLDDGAWWLFIVHGSVCY